MKIIELLKEIESLDSLEDDASTILNNIRDEKVAELVKAVEWEADRFLITNEGACRWENHDFLKEKGYDVFCGERDRFGWLTGGIQTKKGVIFYS